MELNRPMPTWFAKQWLVRGALALLAQFVLRADTHATSGYGKDRKQEPLREVSRRIVQLLNATESEKYFVSFPKSGRTWVRMFLNYYYFYVYPFCVAGRKQKLYEKRIPSITFSHGAHDDFGASSIADIERAVSNARLVSSIVLVRDPRDVLVSYFFHLTKRIPESGLQNNIRELSDIIRHETLGFERIIDFMNVWYAFAADSRNALIVHYEDIRQNTESEFIRILSFLGETEVNPGALERAIQSTSCESMKGVEQRSESRLPYLSAGDVGDDESFKVRKGEVGGYTSYLDEAQRDFLREKMVRLHPALKNYYLGTDQERDIR